MSRITFTNKEDRRALTIPAINRVDAANMNEIKASVNALYDALENAVKPVTLVIEPADFAGSTYTNVNLIGKTPMVQFNVFTNEGSGVLLNVDDSYTFNSGTGTITMDAGNYIIIVYVSVI
jgi:hypothetical protein